MSTSPSITARPVKIPRVGVTLAADLAIPPAAVGVVDFRAEAAELLQIAEPPKKKNVPTKEEKKSPS